MREQSLQRCLPTIADKIKASKVLMVGAGGIGCELLKNLVLTGFGEIHLLDLDTIDLSNLNRQFLFQKQHIKKSKALVAKATAAKFNPHVKLEAYHANIKDAEFNIKWFKQFAIVFNALDNLDARRHVNNMCLAADVPLIESGTTGFLGQVQVIVRGQTECYDCNPKEVPKSFPICTIRSTPSQPIHCIVWAKSYLFNQVFGVDEDESVLDQTADSDNKDELENLRKEANALKVIREAMGTPNFTKMIFQKVFKDDIDRLRSMEDMWKSRTPPDPLEYEEIVARIQDGSAKPWDNDQALWTLEENVRVFQDSVARLSTRLKRLQDGHPEGEASMTLSFEKDDVDTLDFVAAASNIRAHVFRIDRKTKFDIKQMAGNIIAAIATTNAIIAGVCVLQSFKILKNELQATKTVFLSRRPERVFSTDSSAKPNEQCSVCSMAQIVLEADVNKMTLKELIDDVLKSTLKYGDEVSILTNNLIYDADFDDNVSKVLKDLSISDGTFLTVIDDDENEDGLSRINLNVIIQQRDSTDSENFMRPASIDIPYKTKSEPRPDPDMVVPSAPEANGSGEKRKRSPEEEEEADIGTDTSDRKKKKMYNPGEQEIFVIEEGEEIVID